VKFSTLIFRIKAGIFILFKSNIHEEINFVYGNI